MRNNALLQLLFVMACALLSGACSEQNLPLYDTGRSALNFAKGSVFGSTENYPEAYNFHVYFLGDTATHHTVLIPVRLQGAVDTLHNRTYTVTVVDSATENCIENQHYTLQRTQIFRKNHWQDTLKTVLHFNNMSDTANYKLRLALVPGPNFEAGVQQYQYIDIAFTKNLTTPPAFWNNHSKLRKIPYSPRKCAVFLRISGITSPDWLDDGSSNLLDYWISLCIKWFEEHEEKDEQGNRIYFDK